MEVFTLEGLHKTMTFHQIYIYLLCNMSNAGISSNEEETLEKDYFPPVV